MKPYLPYYLATAFFLALLIGKFSLTTGFSELAGFGEDYDQPKIEAISELQIYHKPNSTGYDGQFYVQLAIDPSLRDSDFAEAIDHPSYRSRRILIPAISWLIGGGQPAVIVQVHSLVNVACLVICGFLLLHWIPVGGWENFARWFFCIFSMGALESVRYSLVDLPSLTLALTTIRLLDCKREKLAVVANSLSALSKETSLINAGVFLLGPRNDSEPFSQRLRLAIIAGIGAIVPLGLWMLYVSSVFPINLIAADNIGAPFAGIFRGFADAFARLAENGFSDRYFFRIIALAGLLFQFFYLLAKPLPNSRIWGLGILYGLLFLTLGDAVWRGYWAGCRIALPLTVAFNILLCSRNKRFFWLSIILSNAVTLHAVIRWL